MKHLVMYSVIVILITCAFKHVMIDQKSNYLCILVYNNFSNGIYLMKVNSDTNVMLIDSSKMGKIPPDDLRIIKNNKITYHGNTLVRILGSNNIIKSSIANSFAERMNALILMNDNFILVDSLDISYYNDKQIKEDKYTLLGFDDKMERKLFSIVISKNDFILTKYRASLTNLQYLYYPDYYPKSVSVDTGEVKLKILDLKEHITQIFDTISRNENMGFFYFNPSDVRDEGGGKVSYMLLYRNDSLTNQFIKVKVFEWDYLKKKKSLLYDFNFEQIGMTDNYRHRIKGDTLFFATDYDIYKIVNGKKIAIYSNKKTRILDFLP